MLTGRTSILDRYWVFPRQNGVFYFQDKIIGKQQSARTKDKHVADRLLAAKNQSVEQLSPRSARSEPSKASRSRGWQQSSFKQVCR